MQAGGLFERLPLDVPIVHETGLINLKADPNQVFVSEFVQDWSVAKATGLPGKGGQKVLQCLLDCVRMSTCK